MPAYLMAVDVGTRSARAGVFDTEGHMLARAVADLVLDESPSGGGLYASDQIWQAVGRASRGALATAGIDAASVRGLAFDATCSLVLRDRDGRPLPLGGPGQDTLAWFDHRARAEARDCTATGHGLIAHLGGAMSPEMQTPKLMWLKRRRPDLWARLGSARDLCDHLAGRATATDTASACALAAKWAYLPDHGGWQEDFLTGVGLDDLRARASLPAAGAAVGRPVGRLTEAAAADLGLSPGLPVASGMIDAYAGALGTVGLREAGGTRPWLTLIAGTSNCLMALTPQPLFARGLWGPSRDTVLPGYWTSEGGQTAAGAALEWVLASWPGGSPGHEAVLARIERLLADQGAAFGAGIDVLPDFSGNRSPLSDPSARAMITGLSLDRGFDALCALYWRTAVALALGVRQIIDQLGLTGAGAGADRIALAGGLARSPILKQLFADVTGLTLLRSEAEDVVLLGSAIAAASAAGLYPDLLATARAMTRPGMALTPDPARHAAYGRDYRVMQRLQALRGELAALKA